jgi:hypothetical protein
MSRPGAPAPLASRRFVGALALCLGLVWATGCAAHAEDEAPNASGSAVSLDPAYASWVALAKDHGARSTDGQGQATVIGMRGITIDGVAHATTSTRAYDDLFVVLTKDRRVLLLAGATHPFETRMPAGSGVPDVNRDGVPDVGMIAAGTYLAVGRGAARLTAGLPAYDVRQGDTGALPGFRDTDHDGSFGDAERALSLNEGHTLTSVLFHHAGDGAPRVVGCQVLAPEDMKKLTAGVGGAGASFEYVLIEGAKLDAGELPITAATQR